ncbi:hypothetical protein ACWEPZ_16295 [Streptomyces sp. NPDC004288]|uniref:hypothetical protein n=1 Tax=Streptomyces sp. NPDC059082 TaxID=3346720 RepID=UPI0036C4E3ED
MVRCRVIGTGEPFRICEECDTVWETGAPSNHPPFTILEEHMKQFGKPPLWSLLERLEQGKATAP